MPVFCGDRLFAFFQLKQLKIWTRTLSTPKMAVTEGSKNLKTNVKNAELIRKRQSSAQLFYFIFRCMPHQQHWTNRLDIHFVKSKKKFGCFPPYFFLTDSIIFLVIDFSSNKLLFFKTLELTNYTGSSLFTVIHLISRKSNKCLYATQLS